MLLGVSQPESVDEYHVIDRYGFRKNSWERFFSVIVVESAKHADSRGRDKLQDKPQNNALMTPKKVFFSLGSVSAAADDV